MKSTLGHTIRMSPCRCHVLCSLVDQVQADVAAIAMEEVLPSSVADAEALAPEEVYQKKRGREAEFLEGRG